MTRDAGHLDLGPPYLLFICSCSTTLVGVRWIHTGFPTAVVIGIFVIWFIGTRVVQALNEDKDDSWAWLIPHGEIERC